MADLNHISLFVRVVDEGSFSAAARRLAMPKATVSRNIAQLERDLGVRLLNRTTRKVELTSLGRGFYDEVTRGLTHLESARDRLAAAQAEPSGTLRVTAPVGFGSQHLMHWVAEFLETFAKVRIELRLTDDYVDLITERIDVAFRTGTLANSTFIARKLASTRRVVVASPAYLSRHGVPRRLEDLEHHDCVIFGQSLDAPTWRLEGPDGDREIVVSGRLSVDGAHAALEAAVAGLGIGLLPMGLVASELRAGRLKHLLPRYSIKAALYAVYPSNRHISTALRALIDLAAEKAAGLPT